MNIMKGTQPVILAVCLLFSACTSTPVKKQVTSYLEDTQDTVENQIATNTTISTSTYIPTSTSTNTPTLTPAPTFTSTTIPINTPTRIPNPSHTSTPTKTPTLMQFSPTIELKDLPIDQPSGESWTRPIDNMEMIHIPAGEFEMGSSEEDINHVLEQCPGCPPTDFKGELPKHKVVLDSFWIDQTEVTNRQYQQCVTEGECDPPEDISSLTRSSYYGDTKFDNYPVINVDYTDAEAYCGWVGGRLPTEAEWEYAARGPENRLFPWGNSFDGTRLNYCDTRCGELWSDRSVDDYWEDTALVGSFAQGASWCGALDMAGNVQEWVADSFIYYPAEMQRNPKMVSEGESIVVRGGSFNNSWSYARTARRMGFPPEDSIEFLGFRCARDQTTNLQPTETPLLISDDFSNLNTDWWDLVEIEGVNTSIYGGGYRIEILKENWIFRDLVDINLSDVVVEVDVEKLGVQNSSMGLICRAVDAENLYLFEISSFGYFSINKIIDDEWIELINWTKSDAINIGKSSNHIKAVCDGSNLSLFTNDILLTTVTDEEFSSGSVGLSAGSFDFTPVDVLFDNFVVYQISP
jgi:formylglycine-generating enzyme required for sulfatase activity